MISRKPWAGVSPAFGCPSLLSHPQSHAPRCICTKSHPVTIDRASEGEAVLSSLLLAVR